MPRPTRRQFLATTAATAAGSTLALATAPAAAQKLAPPKLALPVRQDAGVTVTLPRLRVPLSFIIDDSTCLVNMGHFCMPQFAAAWPEREIYKKPWKTWPREIPDAFVREFAQWCGEQGVKGKYSVVPNPACVGWLDRELPGWSRRELAASLKLVRDELAPNWDIHPEMITHTRVIDIKTGRPIEPVGSATMENSYPQTDKSTDELAAYLAYALRILKNCGLPCEGVTTPGGFGNRVKPELSLAVGQAVRDVYNAELPHYFKYVIGGSKSTAPKLEHVAGLGTDDVRLTVNVPAGTGDWFGGWDGDRPSQPDRYATQDATAGRMVELIERRQPAIMLCHWPGMYTQGTKAGFRAFQQVVTALHTRFRDQTIWMKLSQIARYWAAKELTRIERTGDKITLTAPFAAPGFTLRIAGRVNGPPRLTAGEKRVPLREVKQATQLKPGTWLREEDAAVVCFDLAKGRSVLTA